MLKRLLVLFGVAILLGATVAAVAAQPPPIRGPGEPIGPRPPVRPPGPPEPPPIRGPGNDVTTGIKVYAGVQTRDPAFTIVRRGSKTQVESGNGGAIIMTKRGNRIFDGRSITLNAVINTILGGRIMPGTETNVAKASCTLRGARVYMGNSTTLPNVLYTFKGPRMYSGYSTAGLNNVLYTIQGGGGFDVRILMSILAGGC